MNEQIRSSARDIEDLQSQFEHRLQAPLVLASDGDGVASSEVAELRNRIAAIEAGGRDQVHAAALEGRIAVLENAAREAAAAAQEAFNLASEARAAAAAPKEPAEVSTGNTSDVPSILEERVLALEKAATSAMKAVAVVTHDIPAEEPYSGLAARAERLEGQVVGLTSELHGLREEISRPKSPEEKAEFMHRADELEGRLGELATEQCALRKALEDELISSAKTNVPPPPA